MSALNDKIAEMRARHKPVEIGAWGGDWKCPECCVAAPCDALTALDALEAVVGLHHNGIGFAEDHCEACGDMMPCATVRIITEHIVKGETHG